MARQLVLFLHAHLPDCRRPDHPASWEETWFFEALAESYLPLVGILDRLRDDRVPVKLTLSLSPVLLDLLRDRALLERFRRRLERTIELARRDAVSEFAAAAAWHAGFYAHILDLFSRRCAGDLLSVFHAFQKTGQLELSTTAATHALLPAHQSQPKTVRAQVAVALDTFAEVFGFLPGFFWLPECAYYPGLDAILADFGIRAFALESHGVLKASPPGPSVHQPVECPSGVRALARDPGLSGLVWSARHGYPGDPHYREFHRDRVHSLDPAEVHAWLGGPHQRLPSGLKYWRVTGPVEEKALYDPALAGQRAAAHARDFVQHLEAAPENDGTWFVPFDAELFGHWWFEGPQWLEHLFRELARAPTPPMTLETASAAIARTAHPAPVQPSASSWGEAGDFSFWINEETAWTLPRLFDGADRLQRLVRRFDQMPASPSTARALRQAARTLLLAQSSDWPFLLRAGTAHQASLDWIEGLFARFDALCDGLENGHLEVGFLEKCELMDAAFPGLRLEHFRS